MCIRDSYEPVANSLFLPSTREAILAKINDEHYEDNRENWSKKHAFYKKVESESNRATTERYELLERLSLARAKEDYDQIIKTADLILAENPDDQFAELWRARARVSLNKQKDVEKSMTEPESIEATEVIRSLVCSCLLYTSPSPRDATLYRMPSSA